MRPFTWATVTVFLFVTVSVCALAEKIEPTGTKPDASLQSKIDSLQTGISNLDDIEKLFGKPESLEKGVEWLERSTGKKRIIFDAHYPSMGLSFSLFTEPSELYSITITTKEVSVRGLRIGDSLDSVQRNLKVNGAWTTTASQDCAWLDFEKLGLKYGFDGEKGQKKYPMNLVKPETVTRIEIYNNKLWFSGLGIERSLPFKKPTELIAELIGILIIASIGSLIGAKLLKGAVTLAQVMQDGPELQVSFGKAYVAVLLPLVVCLAIGHVGEFAVAAATYSKPAARAVWVLMLPIGFYIQSKFVSSRFQIPFRRACLVSLIMIGFLLGLCLLALFWQFAWWISHS